MSLKAIAYQTDFIKNTRKDWSDHPLNAKEKEKKSWSFI